MKNYILILLIAIVAVFSSCNEEKVLVKFIDDASKALVMVDEVRYVSGDTVSISSQYGRFNIIDGSKLDTIYLFKQRDSSVIMVNRRLAVIQ